MNEGYTGLRLMRIKKQEVYPESRLDIRWGQLPNGEMDLKKTPSKGKPYMLVCADLEYGEKQVIYVGISPIHDGLEEQAVNNAYLDALAGMIRGEGIECEVLAQARVVPTGNGRRIYEMSATVTSGNNREYMATATNEDPEKAGLDAITKAVLEMIIHSRNSATAQKK